MIGVSSERTQPTPNSRREPNPDDNVGHQHQEHPLPTGALSCPRRSDFLYKWFSWWVRGYLKKHFHAVRLARGSRPNVSPDLPMIVVLNHPAWWDPLIGVIIAGLFPERAHYAPMDAKALARYSLFEKARLLRRRPGHAGRGNRLSPHDHGYSL